MPGVKFVVLTSSRTGSTWLIDLLNMQSMVDAHGELFLDERRLTPAIAGREDFPRFIEVHGIPRLTRLPRVVSYLNRLYRTPRSVGFKLMYTQLRRYPEILAYCALRRIKIVHLTRLNQIDVIVSDELARVTGASHAQAGREPRSQKVHLSASSITGQIDRLCRKARQADRLIKLSSCPTLEVRYESLLESEIEFARVLDFLDVVKSTEPIRSKLVKRGQRDHCEAIANYEEIRRELASTPYLWMLR
jgi:LPS sulfotransferase NodH